MPAKEEKRNDQETGARAIEDIPDYRLLATLAVSCFLPLGYLAFLYYYKTSIYKKRDEYEKAQLASKRTYISALASIIVGFFILVLLYFLIYTLSRASDKPSDTHDNTT
ncbi:1700025B11Rik [Phodopus roborovskii]|uniref:1700025B11Rik protein n=1 Tax=Phodopus roborovskii TaxID=109678 RepID=A0AAV0ABC6_PHORO|nr:1700025B11Rik [Phodopus roborovskii]